MNGEGVIVTSFLIDRVNQIKLFQVRIPREAKSIIGVELGMKWLAGAFPAAGTVPAGPGGPGGPGPPPAPIIWPPAIPIGGMPVIVRRNQIIGEVKLQSYEKANIFYSGELVIDQNIDTGDFTASQFSPKIYSHQQVMNEDQMEIHGNTTIVQGVFRNKLLPVGTFQFKVFVYLWVKIKEDQSNI